MPDSFITATTTPVGLHHYFQTFASKKRLEHLIFLAENFHVYQPCFQFVCVRERQHILQYFHVYLLCLWKIQS